MINTGTDAFSFTAALHTYLRVEDVRLAAVEGLKGLRYANSTHGEANRSRKTNKWCFPAK